MTAVRTLAREVAPHAVALLVLLACGAGLVWLASQALARENRALASAQAELRRGIDRLARVAQDEREVREHIELYQQLQDLRILGDERRLEWVEALTRIRNERALAELRYQVERQKVLKSLPGKPTLELRSSTMKVELALLHEGDLIDFLRDLRASGHAYYAVRQCSIARLADLAPAPSVAPRLRAACQIDLITLGQARGGA